MAKLTKKIPKQAYEYILPRIADILVDEINAQLVLPENDLFASAVFLERYPSFDETDMPCINVRLANGEYEGRSYISTNGKYSFHVDCYANAKSVNDENEITQGDVLAALKLHRLLGVCRSILQNASYKTLGFAPPFIERVTVTEINIANPQNFDTKNQIMGRLQIDVYCQEVSELIEPSLIDGYDTQVKMGLTNLGYLFSGDQAPIPPINPCENGEVFINGVKFGEVTSGGQIQIEVQQDNENVGSKVGEIWVVPSCPPSTFNLSVNDTLFKSISNNYNLDILNSNSEVVGTNDPINNKVDIGDSTANLKNTLGALISTTEIKAEGTIDIEAPNGLVVIKNSLGTTLKTKSTPSNGSVNETINNSTLNVQKSDNTLISSRSILAEGTDSYNVADSVAVIKDSSGLTLKSENIKATESENITINDSTVNVRKSDSTLISAVSVKAENSANYNVADSPIVVRNSLSTIVASGNVKATETGNFTAPNGNVTVNSVAFDVVPSAGALNVEVRKSSGADLIGSKVGTHWRIGDSNVRNSDTSYTTNVKATENLVLPDSRINVNSVDRGNVVSVKTIDVNLTDGVNPVTPTSVAKVGNTLTIQVAAGSTPSGIAFQMPKPSQWETFRTGDTGWRARNGWFDYTQPTNPKVYANLDYSAGTNGLYLLESPLIVNGVSSTRRFVDVDGVQTFSGTGSKNLVVIDKLSGLMFTRTNQVGTGGTWEAMIDAALAASITVNGVTYDDWFMVDRSELEQAIGAGYLADPNTGVDLFFQSNATQWTAATRIASSGNAYYYDIGNFTTVTLNKTTPSQRTILVRKAHNLITAP